MTTLLCGTLMARTPSLDTSDTVGFESPSQDASLQLDTTRWENMGSPGIITVTVAPGDQLNSPGRYT